MLFYCINLSTIKLIGYGVYGYKYMDRYGQELYEQL